MGEVEKMRERGVKWRKREKMGEKEKKGDAEKEN